MVIKSNTRVTAIPRRQTDEKSQICGEDLDYLMMLQTQLTTPLLQMMEAGTFANVTCLTHIIETC